MRDRAPISFDRAPGRFEGATAGERCAALAFQAGAEAIVILEGHGGDRVHTVSRYPLNDASCRVFVIDRVSERFERLTDLLILDRIEANAWIGYNAFATRSSLWEERIRSIQ